MLREKEEKGNNRRDEQGNTLEESGKEEGNDKDRKVNAEIENRIEEQKRIGKDGSQNVKGKEENGRVDEIDSQNREKNRKWD